MLPSTSKKAKVQDGSEEVPFSVEAEEDVEPEVPAETFDCKASMPGYTVDYTKQERGLAENLLPQWHSYGLNSHLLRSLHAKNYDSPTPIQSRALPIALSGRDVVGVAETVRLRENSSPRPSLLISPYRDLARRLPTVSRSYTICSLSPIAPRRRNAA